MFVDPSPEPKNDDKEQQTDCKVDSGISSGEELDEDDDECLLRDYSARKSALKHIHGLLDNLDDDA